MKLCVSHVYWMLLFTSVVSSALLFLIVASENIQNKNFIGPDRSQVFGHEDNETYDNDSEDRSEQENQENANIKIPSSLNSNLDDDENKADILDPVPASIDNYNRNEGNQFAEEIGIIKDSFNQQENLSHGVSEGGEQAVVLTLVKTASSLQSLTSSRSEFRSKSEGGNGSAGLGSLEQQQEDAEQQQQQQQHQQEQELVGVSKLLEVKENVTNETGGGYYEDNTDKVVLVVRAEQKSPSSIRLELDQEEATRQQQHQQQLHESEDTIGHRNVEDEAAGAGIQEEDSSQQMQKSQSPAPDLSDSAARAKLTGSVDNDNAAVILDSFVTAGPSDATTHEEIPSFNEWAQKRLEEVEKKKAHPNASVQTANGSAGRNLGNMRMRSKNYASPDCGAKIVATNPESRSARSILVSTRDEYMLNTCTTRVWFVVELCEAIQAKKIELANFELFSSSPKDLSVYVSDRFPTRDWSIVGQFTARDERDVQSFSLQPHLFGKFIKVELHSHYGSEHFCPISLFRAYGTSEFEVLETETETESQHDDNHGHEANTNGKLDANADSENEDEDDEDSVFEDEEDSSSDRRGHLFGSARDAVISIVKKAAEVLVKSDELKANNVTDTQTNQSDDVLNEGINKDCTTPVYNVICRQCDGNRFSRIFQIVSCKRAYLESLLNAAIVKQILSRSHLCHGVFEFDSFHNNVANDIDDSKSRNLNYDMQAQLISSFFLPDILLAMCNVLAANENRLFMNTTRSDRQSSDRIPNETRMEQNSHVLLNAKDERFASTRPIDVVPTLDNDKTKVQIPVIKSKLEVATESQILENFATQIKPTRTTVLNDEVNKQLSDPNLESSRSQQSEDYEAYQYDNSITTESPIPVVTKRILIHSQKLSSGSQDHIQCSQDGAASPHDISISGSMSRLPQSFDQKSVNFDNGDVDSESDEESETKPKVDQADAETKPTAQDQLNFENFDFKDLDVDSLQNNGGIKNDAAVTQQTAASATTPQQKESVFLRLSNRIKALERNMSLSSQYLEELSRRYKKQVEEMQRSLERAMTTMSEESRKGDEREYKRLEEVTILHSQIDNLGKILDDLIYERNSWRISFSSLIQHALIVFVNVILVIFILSYCRRSSDTDLDYLRDNSEEIVRMKRPRGTNYEMVKQQCTQLSKKSKKRRPSEIAAQVSGTYEQLMIEDMMSMNQLSRREKRKRRKRDSVILRTSSIKGTNYSEKRGYLSIPTLPSRSSSVNDAICIISQLDNGLYSSNDRSYRNGRPGSAPDNSIDYFCNSERIEHVQHDRKVQIITTELKHDKSGNSNDSNLLDSETLDCSVLEDDTFIQAESSSSPRSMNVKSKKISSPSFIKTALTSRSKRISFSGGGSKKKSQALNKNLVQQPTETACQNNTKTYLTNDLYISNDAVDEHNNGGRTTNGHVEESDESRSSCATPTMNWSKKEKKSNGLKKMRRQRT